jgi:hypothetical protein
VSETVSFSTPVALSVGVTVVFVVVVADVGDGSVVVAAGVDKVLVGEFVVEMVVAGVEAVTVIV